MPVIELKALFRAVNPQFLTIQPFLKNFFCCYPILRYNMVYNELRVSLGGLLLTKTATANNKEPFFFLFEK